jgi:hypothetical protein
MLRHAAWVQVHAVWYVHGQGGQDEEDLCVKGHAEIQWVSTLPHETQTGPGAEYVALSMRRARLR